MPAKADEPKSTRPKRDAEIETSSTDPLPELPADPKKDDDPKPKPNDTPPPPQEDDEHPAKPAEPAVTLPVLPVEDESKKNDTEAKTEDKTNHDVPIKENSDDKEVTDSSKSGTVSNADDAKPKDEKKPEEKISPPRRSFDDFRQEKRDRGEDRRPARRPEVSNRENRENRSRLNR